MLLKFIKETGKRLRVKSAMTYTEKNLVTLENLNKIKVQDKRNSN